ncbi:unnamed protein product [Sphagnum jensenii]|uniref:Uncharacterized protein n=2 Tax=Sphagnum jensenii TaxID=128206 RepID=A0ABP0VCG1_9BRYO
MEVVKLSIKLGSPEEQRAIAITADGKHHSYGQLLQSAFKLSSSLLQSAQPTRDATSADDGQLAASRVGIMAKPCAEFVAGIWATWLNGAVAVPLALSYPEAELMHVFVDSDISLVISTEEHRDLLQGVAQKCSVRYYPLPSVPSLSNSSEGEAVKDSVSFGNIVAEVKRISSAVEGENPALILYTSGTTGKPKGVVHTHASIGAQVRMLAESWEYTASDRFLHCLPLHHILNHLKFQFYFCSSDINIEVDFMPKFSTRGVWQRWRESYASEGKKVDPNITVFSGVPTMYVRLLQGYDTMDAKLQKISCNAARQLRLMMCGSSALPEPVMEKWEQVTGLRLLERYGMTEFVMALSNPLHGERRAGFVGKPLPGVQVLIAEEAEAEAGVGELCISSPAMFKEYWRKPEVTKESFRDDGFFKTGDTVTIVDGYVKILGRTSVDIVKSGGYKLSALEIEAVLLEHPAIAECAVMGLPDKDYGEIISAVVVAHEELMANAAAKSQAILTLQELQKWAQDRMAPYKIPHQLQVWESLPRNAMGKVNKKELKAILLNTTINN